MQDGANILTLGADLKRAMQAVGAELPVGIQVTQIADQPRIVEESVSEFVETFVEALGIVLLVSFISLGWRTGIVVALSVPLVLAIVFAVMFAAGLDLHRITLGALIIALGLLVDDAIIAIEMMVVKMEQGFDRTRAATFAWTSTAFPMLTGTLVTAAGFLPVGFAKSSAGEYADGIFWVVGLALIASSIVAVTYTPYHGFKLLPDQRKKHADPDAIYDTRIYRALRRVIAWALRWRITVVAATAAAFFAAVAGFPFVQQQFFPTSTRTELFLELRLPEGTAIGVTDAAAKEAEQLLAGDHDISTYTTYVGQGSPRFWLGLNPVLPNPNFAQIVIVTRDVAARERVKARLDKTIAAGALGQARVRVDRFNFGPPVGFPVQFRVVGPDPLKVRAIAEDVRAVISNQPQDCRPPPQLGRDGEVDPPRSRPGPCPHHGAHAAGRLPDAPDAALRLHHHAISRGDRAYRRRRPRGDVRAARPRPPAGADDRDPQWRRGTALAAPGASTTCTRRPILWRRNRDIVLTVRGDIVEQRPGARRHQRGAAQARHHQGRAALRLPHRGPAARSKKAPRQTARSSPSFR